MSNDAIFKKSDIKASRFVSKDGKINDRFLFQVLYPLQNKRLIKSVPNPIAHNTNPCASLFNVNATVLQFQSAILQLKSIDINVYRIALIQFSSGARITQVLRLNSSMIANSGLITLPALKFSNEIIVSIPELTSFFLYCKQSGSAPFVNLDRFYVYRLYKKVGLYIYFGKHYKQAVTHSFRYLFAQSLIDNNQQLESAQTFLRHKSINSTKHYVRNKKTIR